MKKNIIFMIYFFVGYLSFAKNLIIPFNQNEKIGFMNEKMEVIVLPEYDSILLQTKYYVWATKKNKNNLITESTIIFSNGKKRQLELMYEEVISIGDDYFAINRKGSNITSSIYNISNSSEVLFLNNYIIKNSDSEKYILIENPYDKSKARNFFIDLKGNEYLTNNQYLHVVSLDNESRTIFFETKNNDVVLSDFDGKILIQNNSTIMDIGRVGNGLYLGFTKSKGSGYYNTKGELIIPINIDNNQTMSLLPVFNCNVIPCIIENGKIRLQERIVNRQSDNWALINLKGKIIKKNIVAQYISEFSDDGVAVLCKNTKNGVKYELINSKGKIITDQDFDFIDKSINGYARAKKRNIDYVIATNTGKSFRTFEILLNSRN